MSEPLKIEMPGQVALVTGGGAGLGQAIAVELARAGADVVLAEIDPERAEDTAGRIRDLGREALVAITDVRNTDQVREAVAAADERFGRLDILVNNAGGVRSRRFLDQRESSWRNHIDINLVSMLAATHAAAPIMIRGGRGGAIVNITSIEGFRAAPTFAVYAACKAGMVSFTKTMALELSEYGIRVNCAAPDMTTTPGMRGRNTGVVQPEELVAAERFQDGIQRYLPLGREGTPAEFGRAVAFLCSPLASYVTGTEMHLDGGTFASSGWVRAKDGGWSLWGADEAMGML
jgi:NAD(P)-dependent dehydrogenase (short-subunit alcohol dehydrogenase family)